MSYRWYVSRQSVSFPHEWPRHSLLCRIHTNLKYSKLPLLISFLFFNHLYIPFVYDTTVASLRRRPPCRNTMPCLAHVSFLFFHQLEILFYCSNKCNLKKVSIFYHSPPLSIYPGASHLHAAPQTVNERCDCSSFYVLLPHAVYDCDISMLFPEIRLYHRHLCINHAQYHTFRRSFFPSFWSTPNARFDPI